MRRAALIVAVLLAACGREPAGEVTPRTGALSGNYTWHNLLDKRLERSGWTPFRVTRPEGFGPVVAERSERNAQPCLRIEGALLRMCHWLEIEERQLRTEGALQQAFAPVESAEEAISFVAVTIADLRTDKDDRIAGMWRADGERFLVQVVLRNTFGCRVHARPAWCTA